MGEIVKKKLLGVKKTLGVPKCESPKGAAVAMPSSSNKWLGGIQDQAGDISGSTELDEDLDVRAVPVSLIVIDETNPRELDISPNEITDNINNLALPASALEGGDDSWREDYRTKVESVFGKTKKSEDFLNIALFAASLKTPKNMMAPICVWREETSFFLFAGERRFLAHLVLEAPKVVTRIWPVKPTGYQMKMLEWQENNEREDLTNYEKVQNVRQILVERKEIYPGEKLSVRQLAQLISVGRTQASIYMKLASCEDDKFNRLFKGGKFQTLEEAYEVAKLSEVEKAAYLSELDNTSESQNGESTEAPVQRSKPAKSLVKNVIRYNQKADPKPVSFIVKAALEKIGDNELNSAVDKLGIDNPKNINKILGLVVTYLAEKGSEQ